MKSTFPPTVKIAVHLPEHTLRVFADPTQVEQALINLCANAWQAMAGRHGLIDIGAEEVLLDSEAAARVGRLNAGPYVHPYVRDNGPGMDEATVKKVFEPFFTTKAEGEGTGLGLSVVHGIVAGHGGAATVDSALGVGSTFHLWLPWDSTAANTEPVPLEQPAPAGRGKHVVYVDDDEVMALMVGRLLEKAGYRVSGFCKPEEAIEMIKRSASAVDVVVTDLNMPGLSGVEVARQVNGIRADLPVVIGSGNLPQEWPTEVEQAGVRATFHKQNILEELPFLLADLLGLGA